MLTNVKEQVFYRAFDRKRPIVSIDGYNETSKMDHFGNIAIVGSEMEGPDASLERRYKTLCIMPIRLRSGGRDEPPTVSSQPL